MAEIQVVKRLTLTNKTDEYVNKLLASIPAEDIISTHHCTYGWEGSMDEVTVIFYKESVNS